MREWMRIARNEANLTMAETASKVGISEAYYSMIESGERQKRLDITLAVKLAGVFGVDLNFIIAEELRKE